MSWRRTIRTDRGESLIELVVAIGIMGVAVVAIASGITASIMMSDFHRKQSTAGSYVRSFGEAIQNTAANGGYVDCAGTTAYATPAGFSLPSNNQYAASVTDVQYATANGGWSGTCSTDLGAQRLSLVVQSKDGRASETLTVVVRKSG